MFSNKVNYAAQRDVQVIIRDSRNPSITYILVRKRADQELITSHPVMKPKAREMATATSAS
jgi:hypothetical protein